MKSYIKREKKSFQTVFQARKTCLTPSFHKRGKYSQDSFFFHLFFCVCVVVTSDYCLPFCDDPSELRGVGELNNVSTLECSDEKRLPCANAAAAN